MIFRRLKIFSTILLVSIILLGFLLRYNNIYTWPRHGATFDEFAWTWLGINLIQKHTPISWSSQPQYTNRKHLIYQKAAFFLVTPYLEHPPFFGLVAGSFALANGAKDMYHVELKTIRPLALILGTLSILLLFLLAQELYDKKTAFIASLLYATIPTVVVGSRIVQNENFFLPMWMLSLFLITKYIKRKKSIFLYSASFLCGLLVISKIPWVAAAISIFLILIFLKKYTAAFKFLILPVIFFLGFIGYGLYFDAALFIRLWGLQLARYDIGFTSIYALFQKPYLIDRFYLDGWIYWGWFSIILLLIKDLRKNIFVVIPVLSYFIIFLAGIPDEAGHGWYRYPFYPFLIISIALFLKEYFVKNLILTFFFLVFVGTTLFQNTWAPTFGFSYFIFRFMILGWSLSLVPMFVSSKGINKFARLSSYSWIIIFILMNIWSVTLYNEQ